MKDQSEQMKDRFKAMYSMFLLYDGRVCQSQEELNGARETSYAMVGRSAYSDWSLRFWFYPNGYSSFACEERFRGTQIQGIYSLGSSGPVEYIGGI